MGDSFDPIDLTIDSGDEKEIIVIDSSDGEDSGSGGKYHDFASAREEAKRKIFPEVQGIVVRQLQIKPRSFEDLYGDVKIFKRPEALSEEDYVAVTFEAVQSVAFPPPMTNSKWTLKPEFARVDDSKKRKNGLVIDSESEDDGAGPAEPKPKRHTDFVQQAAKRVHYTKLVDEGRKFVEAFKKLPYKYQLKGTKGHPFHGAEGPQWVRTKDPQGNGRTCFELSTKATEGSWAFAFYHYPPAEGDKNQVIGKIKWFRDKKIIIWGQKVLSELKALETPWINTADKDYVKANQYGKITYYTNAQERNKGFASRYITWLDNMAEKYGDTLSTKEDAGVEMGDDVVTWSSCPEADLKAYTRLTDKFKETNALRWVIDKHGRRTFQFNKCGTKIRVIERILQELQIGAPLPGWSQFLLPFIVAWDTKLRSGKKGDMSWLLRPCAGVAYQNVHMACLFSDGDKWYLADPWKQPGNLHRGHNPKKDRENLAALQKEFEDYGKTLTHVKVQVAQGAEGACAVVAFLRAFAAAAALAEGKRGPDLVAAVTGINTDGSENLRWIEDVQCYAKLAHRMIRIYERK